MDKMPRKHAINLIKEAGYENDTAKMMRIFCENRISYAVAQKAFAEGKERKKRESM